MSQLPGRTAATVSDSKITRYLLDPAHPVGGNKAKFFRSFGFSQGNWPDLKRALPDHPQTNLVTHHASTPHGEKYAVSSARS